MQALVEVPLLPLPKFAPHEKQLLAGVAPHVGIEEPQVGELLPDIARHLIEQRSLAVHHLVVREGQHEVFVERVDQAEGQLVVVILAVHGIVPHVAERVVHPAHVPFQAEAEPSHVGRPRDAGPGGRFLRDREHARVVGMDLDVETLDEVDRFEVLAAAVAVGQPLAVLAAVVEVEHRGHGIDPQAVDVVVVEPKERARNQIVGDFVASVVEDQRAPVGMLALPWILVLVERGAVEATQPVAVPREMGRHPVDDHADAGPMQGVDQRHQVFRRSKAARGSEQADRLVAPTGRERMLRGGQELNMGESHFDTVGNEFAFEFGITEPAVRGVARPPPASEVHLIDGERRRQTVVGCPLPHPLLIAPRIAGEVDHLGGRPWRHFGPEPVGIGPIAEAPVRVDAILVERAGTDAGHEQLPDARRRHPFLHRMPLAVPAVEIRDQAHGLGIGGPDGEVHARHAVGDMQLRAEFLVALPVAALAQQMKVIVGEHGATWYRSRLRFAYRSSSVPPRNDTTVTAWPVTPHLAGERNLHGIRTVCAGGTADRDQRPSAFSLAATRHGGPHRPRGLRRG